MSSLVRVGIVGTGFAARLHWEGYQRVYNIPVKVVSVTSKTPQSREDFAHKHGVRAIATIEKLCEHGRRICYAENWVYSPTIANEREIL
ncbi:MAG: Gfo/Idh/MocA family oxidoreductase [Terriglobia bacterium]